LINHYDTWIVTTCKR